MIYPMRNAYRWDNLFRSHDHEGGRDVMSRKSGFAGTALFIALMLIVPQIALLAFFSGS